VALDLSRMSLVFRPVTGADHEAVVSLEKASYPADEAATPEKLRFRIENAPHLFRVLEHVEGSAREIIGFVCATATDKTVLTEESMSAHIKEGGRSVAIHSVVVAEKWRRKGLAKHMLGLYKAQLAESEECILYERVLLITHKENAGLYASCGFQMVGLSEVHHGSQPWYEMSYDLQKARRQDNEALGLPRVLYVNAFSGVDGVAGNPACVVLLRATPLPLTSDTLFPPVEQMSSFAAEMKQPATAFVSPLVENPSFAAVRFFNAAGGPIPLCGHASLAIAHALWSSGLVPRVQTSATLLTASGVQVKLTANKPACGNTPGSNGSYAIDLVAAPPSLLPVELLNSQVLPALAEALGVDAGLIRPTGALASHLGASAPDGAKGVSFIGLNANNDVTVAVSADVFAAMAPNHDLLLQKAFKGTRIVSITTKAEKEGSEGLWPAEGPQTGFKASDKWWSSRSSRGFDVVSRCFNALGEDPVCAAAHAGIAAYWFGELKSASLSCFQSSSLGGLLLADYDAERGIIRLNGGADTFLSGRMTAEHYSKLTMAKH
jgi:predicted PhzF superfamily epimerase YddE/YHI9/ribosomal protein S18 acetylase RimI-like enzyme